ncbi:hypothetical protein BO78DRAFT_414278 [Aspergillus sclerotiicarbonarius CBS 121057]|uniref:Ferric oxidoreductase domain-containing protein n=1 Tax=Aspergillus sclerotiicarbonarius (strain CBS 121057 / IBT 28362) TaxID=1448318 RepID=A0A319F5U1_ASPSB|nr:hypothetical protein BO78DRAFT_414278 [Aspergillus sclerotiicarbonarius CBS 121057]
MSFSWPWHFVTLSDAEKQQRRELLDLRGFYAQCSVLVALVLVRVYKMTLGAAPATEKPTERRSRRKNPERSWLDSPPFAGWMETRRQYIVCLLWLGWLLGLSGDYVYLDSDLPESVCPSKLPPSPLLYHQETQAKLSWFRADYLHFTKALAHVSLSQLPLQVLMSPALYMSPSPGSPSVVSVLTSVPQPTINAYHRLFGRLVLAPLLVAHAFLYDSFFLQSSHPGFGTLFAKRVRDTDVQWGIAAVTMVVTVVWFARPAAIPRWVRWLKPSSAKTRQQIFYIGHVSIVGALELAAFSHVSVARIYILESFLSSAINFGCAVMLKYDIPTLLALSQNARIDLSKFSDQAQGNNLLRQRKASTSVLSEQPVNRSRNASNLSRQSERTLSIPEPSLLHPSRQPSDPPQGIRAHADAGFARFLKEHTSPKHQRVTAGGRIVPMEPPQSPTPKMKQPVHSMNAKIGDEKSSKTSSRNDNRSKLENRQLLPTDTTASVNTSKAAPQPVGSHANIPTMAPQAAGTVDQQFPGCAQTPNLLSAAATAGLFAPPSFPWSMDNQQVPQIGLQAPDINLSAVPDYTMYGLGADPLAWLPNMYQALSTQGPMTSSMPAVQPYPTVTSSSDFSAGSNTSSGGTTSVFSQLPPGFDSLYPSLGLQWNQYTGGQVPVLNQPIMPSTLQTPSYQKSLDDAAKEHQSLTSQLSRLDRYMAMHSWDLDPSSKKLLVEQRMCLVRELDAVRLYKEHLEWVSGRLSTSISVKQNVTNAPPVYVTSSLANSQTLMGPGLCAPSSSCAVPAFPMLSIANALPQPLSLNEPINPVIPFHAVPDTHLYSNNTCPTDMRTSRNSFREAEFSHTPRVEPMRSDKQVQTYGETKSRDAGGAEWKTPTKIAPSDVRKVYHHIEDATRRGESLDGLKLLKELSDATSKLVQQRRDELQESRGSLSTMPGKKSHKAHAGNEIYAVKGLSDGHEAYAPLGRHSRKAWKSGNELRRPVTHGKRGPFVSEADDEDDGVSTSSYLSTTDSWATIHEGDRRLDRKLLEGKGKRVYRDMLTERPRGPFEHSVVSAEALRSTARRAGGQNCSITGEQARYKPRSPATLVNPTDSARQTSMEDMRQPYPQLLTQYFNKDRGLAFQKTAALAVSQNVNAHGFLPPFEGVGNAPNKNRAAPMDISEGGRCLLGGKASSSKQHDGSRPKEKNALFLAKQV